MLMNGHIAINKEGALIDADGVIPDYDKLPVYEVEFIPIERRVSPGRRAVDIEMAFQF
jgi:hypothetical protein